jgi:hypothetical protein
MARVPNWRLTSGSLLILVSVNFQGCHRFQSFEDGTPPVKDDSINWAAFYPNESVVGGVRDPDNHHHWGYLRDSAKISIHSAEKHDSILRLYLTIWDSLKQADDTLGMKLVERLDELRSMRHLAHDNQGSRVLEFRYLYDVENLHDEESGLKLLIGLPWDFRPEEGMNYNIQGGVLQFEAWGWGKWVGDYRLRDPTGYVRFLADNEDRVTILAEVTAQSDEVDRYPSSRGGKERTVIAGRVTFVKKGPE